MPSLSDVVDDVFAAFRLRAVKLELSSLQPDMDTLSGFKSGTAEMLKCMEIFKSWEDRLIEDNLQDELATPFQDIQHLSERYSMVIHASVTLAEQGSQLCERMIDVITYVAASKGKGKAIGTKLEALLAVGQTVSDAAVHFRDAFGEVRESLEGLRKNLMKEKNSVSKKKDVATKWKKFFDNLGLFVSTIAVVFGALGFLAALPLGHAVIGAITSEGKAPGTGGVLATAGRALAGLLKDRNTTEAAKLDKVLEFLLLMEEEVPNVTGHVSRLEVWWGHQGSVLSQMVSRGRRFKLEGGKGGVEALGEIKAQWEQVGENFGTYIDDVKPAPPPKPVGIPQLLASTPSLSEKSGLSRSSSQRSSSRAKMQRNATMPSPIQRSKSQNLRPTSPVPRRQATVT